MGDDIFTAMAGTRALWDAARGCAEELGLFEAVGSAELSVEEMARAVGVGARRLRALVDVLAFDGALVRRGGRFAVGKRGGVGAIAGAGWGRMAEVLRSDRALTDGEDDEARRRFHRHLAEVGRAAARELAGRLADELGSGALLDGGGGAGHYTAALLDAAPDARATLVDRAEVTAIAREALASYGERVRFVDGELEEVAFDGEFRVALLCNVLHLHSPSVCERIVERMARAVQPGGRVVVKDLFVEEGRTGPGASVLFALNMALYTDGGDVWDGRTIAGFLHRAGLDEITVERMGEESVVIAGRRW